MFRLLCLLFFLPFNVSAQDTAWTVVATKTQATPRHENSFVECNGKLYALGGRGTRPVDEYDPKTMTWTAVSDAPMEFNHFQALTFKNEIYVIGAFQGSYPHEKVIANFLIFNPSTKTWREGAALPADRLRGSVGVFAKGDKIYVVCGIKDGHYDGHVSWFDEYDTKTGKWSKLPDAPRPRDHFSAALIGNKVYLAGGRTSHAAIGKVLENTIPEIDVYDFKTNSWSTLSSSLPTPRGGTSTVVKGQYLAVMNGETATQISGHAEVEILDTKTGQWSRLPNLRQGRHGTGVAYYQGKIYVAAGSANRGGGPELNEMESIRW